MSHPHSEWREQDLFRANSAVGVRCRSGNWLDSSLSLHTLLPLTAHTSLTHHYLFNTSTMQPRVQCPYIRNHQKSLGFKLLWDSLHAALVFLNLFRMKPHSCIWRSSCHQMMTSHCSNSFSMSSLHTLYLHLSEWLGWCSQNILDPAWKLPDDNTLSPECTYTDVSFTNSFCMSPWWIHLGFRGPLNGDIAFSESPGSVPS